MTITLFQPPPRPASPPGMPPPGPPTAPQPGAPGPQWARGVDPIPVPTDPPPPPSPHPAVTDWSCYRCGAGFIHARLLAAHLVEIHNEGPALRSLRIGHGPRLPRRQRIARVLHQCGRYALAWGFVSFACWWLDDVHLFVPGMVLAAMVANPRRPKTSRPRVPAVAALPPRGSGETRRSGAGTTSGLGAPPLRRPVYAAGSRGSAA